MSFKFVLKKGATELSAKFLTGKIRNRYMDLKAQ